jgi:hypothetical protein
MKEEWRDVVGYEGIYQVSNTGLVKSLDRIVLYKNGISYNKKGVLLSERTNPKGYRGVGLYKENKVCYFDTHRLAAMCFMGVSDKEVNHIDGNKANNNISNLEYVTSQSNQIHYRVDLQNKKRGSYFCKRSNKWYVLFSSRGSYVNMGFCDSKEDGFDLYYVTFCLVHGFEPWTD